MAMPDRLDGLEVPLTTVCIHGHFYQPPREDPWTGRIEPQPSAAPFRDWNARITAECYRPNLAAPLVDWEGAVRERVNCWEHISFDVGPTLMRWLEEHALDVHDGIVQADRAATARTGHGPAMAQGYHHAILPLCSDQDRKTEILWGLADFRHRFGRDSEGFWLPETAVDTATLCDLAQAGVKYVILAPRQAADLHGGDSTEAYRIDLPGGLQIAAFYYDGECAQGVAFDGWLHDGVDLAQRLGSKPGGLVHLATDGESYGHHHRHGEMALASAIKTLEQQGVSMTTYGAWLAEHPPVRQTVIREGSSWSCSHGLGRWSENCGCAMDPARSGHHEWRRTLRRGLNRLRDRIDQVTMPELAKSGEDPWDLRNRYMEMMLDPTGGELDPGQRVLLEAQRHRLMMFTSCGWFFDSPAGLETTQILRYAVRATELVRDGGGPDLRPDLERDLEGLLDVV